MQRLAMALVMTTVILCAGFATWKAEAMVGAGAAQVATAAKTASPVDRVACGGRGAHCPPGYWWNGNRCAPC
jgi:hypothetical protein